MEQNFLPSEKPLWEALAQLLVLSPDHSRSRAPLRGLTSSCTGAHWEMGSAGYHRILGGTLFPPSSKDLYRMHLRQHFGFSSTWWGRVVVAVWRTAATHHRATEGEAGALWEPRKYSLTLLMGVSALAVWPGIWQTEPVPRTGSWQISWFTFFLGVPSSLSDI